MERAATEVMQSIVFSAVLDAIAALKSASGGLPNQLLRDVQAIHANVTFADLPKELQAALSASVRSSFQKLLKEGYSVAPTSTAPQRPASPIPNRGFDRSRDPRSRTPGGRDRPRGDRPGGGGRPSGGGRPGGGGKPGGGRGGPSGGGKPSGG